MQTCYCPIQRYIKVQFTNHQITKTTQKPLPHTSEKSLFALVNVCLCVCMYLCMYVYASICLRVCVLCVFLYVCLSKYLSDCMYAYLNLPVIRCVFACVSICMYVCMSAYVSGCLTEFQAI